MKKNRNQAYEKDQNINEWERFESPRNKKDRASRLEKSSRHKHHDQKLVSSDDINRWFATEWEKIK